MPTPGVGEFGKRELRRERVRLATFSPAKSVKES